MDKSLERIVFYAPNAIGGVMTYLLNFSELLTLSNTEHLIVFYGEDDRHLPFIGDNNRVVNVYFNKFDSYKFKLWKLSKYVSPKTIIVANDRLEVDMCIYYKLSNKLAYIMHGDLVHYHHIMKESVIDIKFFVSDHLFEKFGARQDDRSTVVFPTLKINSAIAFGCKFKTPGELKIAYIGRLEYEKGADEIVIMDRLLKINWGFFIPTVGSDLLFIDGIKCKTIFFDLVNTELLTILQSYDFLFFPSRSEGFGIAVLEAMNMNLIPIVRDIDMGIMQNLEHGVSAIKFSSIDKLGNDIFSISNDRKKFEEMVCAGKSLIKEKFNREVAINNFLSNIYMDLSRSPKHFEPFSRDFSFFLPNIIYKILKKFVLRYGTN